ncbi:hypothetical protein [Burkholderia sp. PU8-34]
MMPAQLMPQTPAVPDSEPALHEASACLRPFCCNPFAAFSAFSRVGGWTPPLPEANVTEGVAGDA